MEAEVRSLEKLKSRKRNGGGATTLAIPASFTCCMLAPADAGEATRQRFVPEKDNQGVILQLDNQMRPTSRQRMQRLADELAAEGLVKFISNPKHKRSKLVQLTHKGDAHYRELNARLLLIASTMGGALSEPDIRRTTEIIRQLSDDVKVRSERLS